MTGDKPAKQKFKIYPIGYFHIDIAEVRTEEGKLHLYVGIDRTSKFAFAQLHDKANRRRVPGSPARSRAIRPAHHPDRQQPAPDLIRGHPVRRPAA